MSNQPQPFCDQLTDRIFGAYLGAAIGDAMGGPVETWHAKRIKQTYGRVDRLMEYPDSWVLPAFALQKDAGSVTDDTLIRDDFTKWVLANPDPAQRTPEALAHYLLWNMSLRHWWHAPIDLMVAIKRGEVSAREAGTKHPVGGRAGAWTSFGLIWAGHPDKAASEVMDLAAVFKAPIERHLAAAVQAGTAVAVMPDATVERVVEAMRTVAGPRGTKLIDRAVDVARRNVGDLDAMVDDVYRNLLIDYDHFEFLFDADGPLPEPSVAPDDLQLRTTSAAFAEQVPLAVAAFVFGQGDYMKTMVAGTALGRDNDSICTSLGTWIGGMVGFSGLPRDFVNSVITVNRDEIDFLNDAWRLTNLALQQL